MKIHADNLKKTIDITIFEERYRREIFIMKKRDLARGHQGTDAVAASLVLTRSTNY